MPTMPTFCVNPDNRIYPGDDLYSNGFKPTTIGDNRWLNYIFWYCSIHSQIPVGALTFSLNSVRDGYLPLNGGTIGTVTSGATYQGDDYKSLFTVIWGVAFIAGGRGASADADWAANKTATLPHFDGVQLILNTETQPYVATGSETYGLVMNDLPKLQPVLNDPGHSHGLDSRIISNNANHNIYDDGTFEGFKFITPPQTGSSVAGISIPAVGNIGSATGEDFNTVPPSFLGYWMVKY
jgi:hypothetical protein